MTGGLSGCRGRPLFSGSARIIACFQLSEATECSLTLSTSSEIEGSEMRSVVSKIGITVSLILSIGIALRTFSTLATPKDEFGVLIVQPTTSILRFEETGHACGGPNSSWTTGYITHSGKRLSLSGAIYSSQSEAIQKLRSWGQGAIRIQEIGARYNKEGQIVGERVVGFMVVGDKDLAFVVWSQVESVFAIQSESLDCVIEFERSRIL